MLRKDYSHHNLSAPTPSGMPSKPEPKNNLHFWRDLNIFLILFFFCSFFIFLFLNGGAFWRDLRYALFLNSPFASSDLKNGDILAVTNAAEQNPGTGGNQNGSPTLTPGSSSMLLTIPKINAITPIVVPKDGSKSTVLASLEGGVGLYPGSVSPGQDGRAVLLGHSSKATWYHGDYAYIFTLINHLEAPDEFYISANGKKYVYQVFAHKTLSKADTDALMAGPAQGSEIDLVTCYPIGGASQRTVIQAKLLRIDNI